ncbi:glutamine--fructose-6-phosphate transaminase (isomerizing) [Dialister micraerophilus]|uniref:Glutamine--fructose-6-phosphate aminotransferase [isomerizing] n=1 Tax=Dialister micraerophilus UPII 345-E TaxID=910314 RepID=E4LAE8_9FIRM|nr:glutamine--fructose-6-phosphate transaminase (isomerizing) [Dialister micraerophilus]EFR42208.1 glutamine-fructose-6-phosphate transaminase (isomerizing) [Dialister micraerophilus UPII 345-E]
MCGILGYVGDGDATKFLIEGLRRLEYRGYDSSGIAIYQNGKFEIAKKKGRLSVLEKELQNNPLHGHIGIGHTRWATHGQPSDKNSHPHGDSKNKFVIVHNGIIENYLDLKKDLLEKGHVFKSETDSEVVAHLAEEFDDGDFLSTIRKVISVIEGSYTLVFANAADPDTLICTKKDNPLIIGLGENENFIASDIPAIISHTRRIYVLNDGEIGVVKKDSISVYGADGLPISKKVQEVTWSVEAAEKGGYPHFMLKEIFEQPKAVHDTSKIHISKEGDVVFDNLNWKKSNLERIDNVLITACGTAYHAGLVAKHYIERFAKIPVEVDIASEYRYRQPLTDGRTLAIVVSQSGETIDTLAALKEAKRLGAQSIAITNSIGSSIAREADNVIYTIAGPEIAVASTKAYTTQLVALLLFALYMGQIKGTLSKEEVRDYTKQIVELPDKIKKVLKEKEHMEELAERFIKAKDIFYLGRSIDYAIAMEGALKLKEISYIHAEAYAGGELKHGTLALITKETPIIAVATQDEIASKMYSNIQEVRARGADVFGIGYENDENLGKYTTENAKIPRVNEFIAPVLSVIPMQLLAYYTGIKRGNDVDKPRNLAKSVTVE